MTPNKGYEIKLSKKESDDLGAHLQDSEIIRGSPPPPSSSEAKDEFRDRQLDMALEYLRGQIKTASRKNPGRDVDDR